MALYAESHIAKRPRLEYHHPFPGSLQTLGCPSTNATTVIPNTVVAAASPHHHHHHHHQSHTSPHQIVSQQYIEQQLSKRPLEPEKPNHILLFTILNPTYPVTCDVLSVICSPIGSVLRIVIFKKNGVQAMVEFDSLESARTAKESLHGCDIYSGCCTLKIEYAKPVKLNVYKNDSESWDFTNPNLGKCLNNNNTSSSSTSSSCSSSSTSSSSSNNSIEQRACRQRPVLLKEPILARNSGNHITEVNGSFDGLHHSTSPAPLANGYETGLNTVTLVRGGPPVIAAPSAIVGLPGSTAVTGPLNVPSVTSAPVTSTSTGFQGGSVCMVYGLSSEKMNAQRLFNLFCLYGNVVRVKFLKTKEGCAMIQMGDAPAVERAVSNLNNIHFFGSKMQLGFSKQAFLADVQSPYALADGSPSFRDFMGSKNNRFINPEMASKNRIQPPSKILHFFNTPPGLEASEIEKLFTDAGSRKPACVKMFPSKTERSSSGLIEFESLSDALEGLVICNHQPVTNPTGKFPYIMKLCFSSSRSIPTTIR